jgi:hypothetical protein
VPNRSKTTADETPVDKIFRDGIEERCFKVVPYDDSNVGWCTTIVADEYTRIDAVEVMGVHTTLIRDESMPDGSGEVTAMCTTTALTREGKAGAALDEAIGYVRVFPSK